MKIKIQIRHVLGHVLFEYECENNTLARTIRVANLRGANLRESNLNEADLRGANLYGANLYGANLYGANLRGANLYGANLYGANLYGANLREANLREANLRGAKNAEHAQAQTYIVAEGSIIGWKKCKDNHIVKLRIPEGAKRSNATGRKCRAEYADVLEIFDLNDKRKRPDSATSKYKESVIYRVGERVTCDKWDDNRWEECSGGIHFFITRVEAENYNE